MERTGLIHIYCGNGKGKTTCGMGLCSRAAGYGYKVLIYQFMKDNSTSERNTLLLSENIFWLEGLSLEKFSFQMNNNEKEAHKSFYHQQFDKIVSMVKDNKYSVLFLDEIIYAINAGLFDEEKLLNFIRNKPSSLEVIMTGQFPSEKLISISDYVSEINKVKHPFECGISAREGIEH